MHLFRFTLYPIHFMYLPTDLDTTCSCFCRAKIWKWLSLHYVRRNVQPLYVYCLYRSCCLWAVIEHDICERIKCLSFVVHDRLVRIKLTPWIVWPQNHLAKSLSHTNKNVSSIRLFYISDSSQFNRLFANANSNEVTTPNLIINFFFGAFSVLTQIISVQLFMCVFLRLNSPLDVHSVHFL